MKKTSVEYWEVISAGEDLFSAGETVAKFSSQEEAKKCATYLTKTKKWPHRVNDFITKKEIKVLDSFKPNLK